MDNSEFEKQVLKEEQEAAELEKRRELNKRLKAARAIKNKDKLIPALTRAIKEKLV